MPNFLPDLRYGLRRLARRPVFTVAVVSSLALGVAASTTAFSFVQGVLLRPLAALQRGGPIVVSRSTVLAGDYQSIVSRNTVLEHGELYTPKFLYLRTGCNSRGIIVTSVSEGYFPLLRVTPVLGRVFRSEEYRPGHERVVILSDHLWRECFGANQSVLGSRVELGGGQYTVVGVMPGWFRYHEPAFWPAADLVGAWTPLALNQAQLHERGAVKFAASGQLASNGYYTYLIARLQPGTRLVQANSQLHAIAVALSSEHPEDKYLAENLKLVKPIDWLVGLRRKVLWLMFAVSCLPLLVGCLNAAGLMVAEGLARAREMAIRRSLGAEAWQLLRLSLVEGLAVGLCGAALGAPVAYWGARLFVVMMPAGEIPRLEEVHVGTWTVLFAVLAAATSALAASILAAARSGVSTALASPKDELSTRPGIASPPTRVRTQAALITGQAAMATALLVTALLVGESLRALRATSPGFDPHNVLEFAVSPVDSIWGSNTGQEQRRRLEGILDAVKAVPGISSAGFTTDVFPGVSAIEFNVGREASAGTESPVAWWQGVTDGYFKAMRIPLLQGKTFDALGAGLRTTGEAIVNRTLAQRYFPSQSPIGGNLWLKIPWTGSDSDVYPVRIVGVVADVKMDGLERPVMPEIYTSALWLPPVGGYMVLKTRLAPALLTAQLTDSIRTASPKMAATPPEPFEARMRKAAATERFVASVTGTFAFIALALTLIGVYGMLARLIRSRTREVGLRRALGAQDRQILRWIFGKAGVPLLLGVCVGCVVAAGLAQLLKAWIYGVSMADPFTYALAALALLGAGFLAAFLPAQRALSIDPAAALRHE
jgi:putative ABC transport system permease protein